MARARNNKATVLGIGIVALIVGIGLFFAMGKDAFAANNIKNNGTPAIGVIVDYKENGSLNDEYLYNLEIAFFDAEGELQSLTTADTYTGEDLEKIGAATYDGLGTYSLEENATIEIAYLDGKIAITEDMGFKVQDYMGYGSIGLIGIGALLIVVGIIVLIKAKGKKAEETPVVSAPINVRPINGTGNPNAPRNNNGYPPQNTQNRPPARDVFDDFGKEPPLPSFNSAQKPAQQNGTRFCSHCGTKLGTNEKFCPNCGAKND